MTLTHCPLAMFHTRMRWSYPADSRMFSAVGCHSRYMTRRLLDAKANASLIVVKARSIFAAKCPFVRDF